MPEYAPGTPSWIDLSSADPDGSARFYSEVMGWRPSEPGGPETGGYRTFEQQGKAVAGLMQTMQEGQPTAWATYVSVADADETAGKVEAAGGSMVVEPMDVTDIGRMAFFADPAGAVFGVWQPKTFTGADIVNEPNSLCWNELRTRDPEGAKSFYPSVFGWHAGRPGFEGAPDGYVVWEVDGRGVAGAMTMDDQFFPPEVPPHWSVAFAVEDCDATVEAAKSAGASVTVEPFDSPIGRFASLIDPQGAPFEVIALAGAPQG